MKKTLLICVVLSVTLFCSLSIDKKTQAACGSSFNVGSEIYYNACTGTAEKEQAEGFYVDITNNKIILDNYHGEAISYFCNASCPDIKKIEIELIGNNTINSQISDMNPNDAAFINIIPTFSGSGTLTINAKIPFYFDTLISDTFTIKLIGNDYEKNTDPQQAAQNNSTSTTDKEIAHNTTTGTTEEKPQNNPSSSSTPNEEPQTASSFFETPVGFTLLIAIPSILIIIIVALLIILKRKTKSNTPTETTTPNPLG